jgi:hypothetical protein
VTTRCEAVRAEVRELRIEVQMIRLRRLACDTAIMFRTRQSELICELDRLIDEDPDERTSS